MRYPRAHTCPPRKWHFARVLQDILKRFFALSRGWTRLGQRRAFWAVILEQNVAEMAAWKVAYIGWNLVRKAATFSPVLPLLLACERGLNCGSKISWIEASFELVQGWNSGMFRLQESALNWLQNILKWQLIFSYIMAGNSVLGSLVCDVFVADFVATYELKLVKPFELLSLVIFSCICGTFVGWNFGPLMAEIEVA